MVRSDVDSEFIDQVVRGVLKRIDFGDARSSENNRTNGQPVKANSEVATRLSNSVLTEDILKGLKLTRQVLVSERTILTPSAKDYLRRKNITWSRTSASQLASEQESARWSVLLLNDAPRIQPVIKDMQNVSLELVSSNSEAVAQTISKICRASSSGVLICTENVYEVACRVNRQPKVRAAVVSTPEEVRATQTQIQANVFCIHTKPVPLYTVRNLIREITQSAPPTFQKWGD